MFQIKKIDGKDVYYSDILPAEHFFTSRDLPVLENKQKIADYLSINIENIIRPNQTHSTNIELVQKDKKEYKDCDSLILAEKDMAIYLNFADCVPIILYDEKNNIGAVVHGGWRGTAGKIASKTVLKMKELFKTEEKDIVALIGPAISFECFETSFEAIEQLKASVENQEGLFKERFADLKGINKRQLEEIGVEKIDVCPCCTVLDNDKFFSYRKENQTNKRHSALIKL